MDDVLSLRALIARSDHLHAAWREALREVALEEDEPVPLREHLTLDACSLTQQHGIALRLLVEAGLETSGVAMLRAQHEALLRAVWTLYAATERDISTLGAPHTVATLKSANSLPMAKELLEDVEKSEAPEPLKRALREFRDISWAGMNSYAHAGLLALGRVNSGHLESHLIQLVQVSNAHCYAANMLEAGILGTEETAASISIIALAHPGCMLAVRR
jgi:hypothetical protein